MTMTLVETVTVGSGGAANITFSSIPQTQTDLVVTLSGYDNAGNIGAYIRFNSDSATNYKWLRLRGTGPSAGTGINGAATQIVVNGSGFASNAFGSISIYIPNYTSSVGKSVSADGVNENNTTGAYQELVAGSWSGTSAINSITLTAQGGTWAQYSTASLYTITKGSGGATVS